MANNHYIVTGYYRSGTSMIMAALEAGGMDVLYDPTHHHINHYISYEMPNPKPTLDKVVKIPCDVWEGYGDVKVIVIRRRFDDLARSYQEFFQTDIPVSETEIEKMLKNVKGDIIELWYHEVLNNPTETFKLLKSKGWGINVTKAAEAVNEKRS